ADCRTAAPPAGPPGTAPGPPWRGRAARCRATARRSGRRSPAARRGAGPGAARRGNATDRRRTNAVSRRDLPVSVVRGRASRARLLELLLDARSLARQIPQVVELRAAHAAAALDGDVTDRGAVRLEDALDALAVGDLA